MSELENYLVNQFSAKRAYKKQTLQTLWSGYGSIDRYSLEQAAVHSIIVKSINTQAIGDHPRGWNSQLSHQRKIKSYQVESHWYQHVASNCTPLCRVARCHGVVNDSKGHTHIVLEDLDEAGFTQRQQQLSPLQTQPYLQWLANFHATFIYDTHSTPLNKHTELWETGTYWHLDTRPDEHQSMADSPLKEYAATIDKKLKQSRFQTLVHGDAKVANFCSSKKGDKVAAVDFQYVGGGCGMKDVVYFLGSCLNNEDCEKHYKSQLHLYFLELHKALDKNNTPDAQLIIEEWEPLFTTAWADFHRFILGWSPQHQKNNAFSQQIALHEISLLKQKSR